MKICEAPCGLLCNDNGFWVEHDEETNQDILCNKADGAFPATRDHLGSVQIGHGLDIDETGIISLDGRRDIGNRIFYYEGTALPSIDISILKECYEKFKDAYYLSLIWHKDDVDITCAIVETDDDGWTKSLNLIIYNKYYCSYKWNPLTRDFVDPEVTTFDTMGMFVGIVTNGDSFPVQRLDGTPINDGDYVLVSNMSSFPFSIGDITFNSPRDKAVYVDDKWNLIEAVIQDTDETVVTDPRVESLSGLGSYQADVNREVKNFINVNVSMPTLAPTDNPWLIRADYEGRQLDDEFARRYINRYQECLPKIKGTTSVYKGDLFGQNVGGTYDNSMTFVVRTSKNERHMIGTVSNVPQLTREFVESKAWHDYYRLLPYLINEGQNDEGLFVGAGSVPTHETLEGSLVVPTTGTNPSSDQEVCATMLPALLLLHCKTVVEAIEMIGNLNIYCPHTPVLEEELHFIIGDKTDLILVEFLDNSVVITDLTTENQVPWALNFYQSRATFVHRELPNVDHIGSHANGLNRCDVLNDNYDSWSNKDEMLITLQDDMHYTYMYTQNQFGDEFCGQSEEYGDLTIEQWVADPSSFDWVRDAERVKYDNRDRDIPNTWQTVYTAVHTIDDKKLYIVAQEDGSGQQYEFEMIHSSGGIGYEPDLTHGIELTSVDKLGVRLDNERGLEFNSDGELAVKADFEHGLNFNEEGKIFTKIDISRALEFNENGEISVKTNRNRAVEIDGDGSISAKINENRALEFDEGGNIAVKINESNGIMLDEAGNIGTKIDNTTLKYNSDGFIFAEPQQLYVTLSESGGSTKSGVLSSDDLAILNTYPKTYVVWGKYTLMPAFDDGNIRHFWIINQTSQKFPLVCKAQVNLTTGEWQSDIFYEYPITEMPSSKGLVWTSTGVTGAGQWSAVPSQSVNNLYGKNGVLLSDITCSSGTATFTSSDFSSGYTETKYHKQTRGGLMELVIQGSLYLCYTQSSMTFVANTTFGFKDATLLTGTWAMEGRASGTELHDAGFISARVNGYGSGTTSFQLHRTHGGNACQGSWIAHMFAYKNTYE